MCHVIRKSLRLCCVDQSGTSIQILQEPRDTFFYKITTLRSTNQHPHTGVMKIKLHSCNNCTSKHLKTKEQPTKPSFTVKLHFLPTWKHNFWKKCIKNMGNLHDINSMCTKHDNDPLPISEAPLDTIIIPFYMNKRKEFKLTKIKNASIICY